MRFSLRQWGFGVVSVLLVALRPAAAQQPGLITGRVVDTAAIGVSGAEVRVVVAGGETRIAFTNDAGAWSMRFVLAPDRYVIGVRAVGFAPARFTVESASSGVAVADVQLVPMLLMRAVTATPPVATRSAP